MNEIVNTQTYLFLACIQIGILMGILYDLIRLFRNVIKHPHLIVQLEDLLYWLICAGFAFYMIYNHNYGAIRPYVFIGILLGGIFYFCTFSVIFMKIGLMIIDIVKQYINKLINLLLIPIRWILRILHIPLRYIVTRYTKINTIRKHKMRRIKRRWYHAKADIRTELRIKKNKKTVYKHNKSR